MKSLIKQRIFNRCVILTLNRPERLNALNSELLGELSETFDKLQSSDARALIITGSGEKAFCAGADIGEIENLDIETKKQKAELGQSIFAKLDTLPMPSVALINGYAFGGGLELALACTFRLATPNASMGLPEIKIGLVPGYGGTQRLPRVVGEARALEMILTGRSVPATEAFAIGLVHKIVENNDLKITMEFVNRFASFSRSTLSFSRKCIAASHGNDLTEGLAVEAELSTQAYEHEDAKEGISAFIQKRSAVFNRGT